MGRFSFVPPTPENRAECIRQFRAAPQLLRDAVQGLSEEQLLSRYRPGGWTLAQVVHHLAEADANAYPRLKYALTEEAPEVLVAREAVWAELADARSPKIAASLAMYEGIGLRWAEAFEAMTPDQFDRKWKHAHFGIVAVDFLLQQYAWHGRHHAAQITEHRKRMGW